MMVFRIPTSIANSKTVQRMREIVFMYAVAIYTHTIQLDKKQCLSIRNRLFRRYVAPIGMRILAKMLGQ